MKTPYCQHCKATNVPLAKNSKTSKGIYNYMCRGCNTARAKAYRSTKEGKKHVYEAVYRSTKKHWAKAKVRAKLNYCVRTGKVIKPNCCESCHEKKKLDGHHEDYSKPLAVKWLCRPCHADADKKMRLVSPLSWMIRPSEALAISK